MTEWFERWFGEEYLALYPHRNEEDARQAVQLVAQHVPVRGQRVLDLACGTGRHVTHFTRLGARVVGLDLSRVLLHKALELRVAADGFVRGDIRRLPIKSGTFRVAVNLFTSFGYFGDPGDDARVLGEAHRALSPGGFLVLDYFHAGMVRRTLVPREEQQLGGQHVLIERRISPDGNWVVKDLRYGTAAFQERVRLYDPSQLEQLLGEAGFTVVKRFGAYDGRPLTDGSPRAILVSVRP